MTNIISNVEVLSRSEMKKIMAGSGDDTCRTEHDCESKCECRSIFQSEWSCCSYSCCIVDEIGEN